MKKIILPLIFLFAGSFALAEEKPVPTLDPAAVAALLKPLPDDKILGDKNAPVTMIEYASLSCPHCGAFAREIMPKIEEKYIKTGKVKYIYRHFPLNPPALKGALLAECAGPEQFYTYIKVLFDSQSKWAYSLDSTPVLRNIANLGGMDDEAFDGCIEDKKLQDKIADERLKGEKILGITSTPTIYINQQKFEGEQSFDTLAKIIDEDLAKNGK